MSQCRLVSESSITLIAGKRSFVCVRADVGLETCLLRKRRIAHVASIGLLTSVRTDMVLKMGRVDCRIGAIWAGVQDHKGFSGAQDLGVRHLNASFGHTF